MRTYVKINIVFISTVFSLLSVGSSDSRQCQAWNQVIQNARTLKNIDTNCTRYKNCEGVDCVASYKYNGPLTGFRDYHEDFNVGISLENCQRKLEVYVESESKKINKTYTFITNPNQDDYTEAYEIPEAAIHVNIPYIPRPLRIATPYIEVKMTRICKDDSTHWYTRIGVKVKVKVGNSFIPNLERQVIPETDIPASRTCAPSLKGSSCLGMTTVMTTNMPATIPVTGTTVKPMPGHSTIPVTVTTVTPMPGPSNTYRKSCNSSSFDSITCSRDQTCRDGKCVCNDDYKYDKNSNICIGSNLPPKPTAGPNPQTPGNRPHHHTTVQPSAHNSSKTNKKTILIGVGVTLGVLILGLILAVVVYRYRKFKQRYGAHDLLMSEEDVVI